VFITMCSGSPEGELGGTIVFVLLVGIALAGGSTWLAELHRGRRYRAFAQLGGSFLPADASPPALACRLAEAVILAAAGTVVLVMTATNRSTGGLLLRLGQVSPAVAKAHLIVFVCAAVGTLAAVVLTLRQTAAGVLLTAAVLCLYGWLLNGPWPMLDHLASSKPVEPVTKYTIALEHDITGAGLWVNNVYLGKTPVETTLDAFHAKVPPWAEPPPEHRDRSDAVRLTEHGLHGESTSFRHRWMRFPVPSFRDGHRGRARSDPERLGHYYARVKRDGEWGGGRGAGAGSSGGRYTRTGHTTLRVCFPTRLRRIETLLDKARLCDYAIDAGWARAMDTYGKQAWLMAREACEQEPRLRSVLNAWAAWRYGLGEATDAPAAWSALQRVASEADERRYYSTASIAGRAVELLSPKLDPKQLVTEVMAALKRYQSWPNAITIEHQYGQRQFSVLTGGERTPGAAPASVAALAHAIWLVDRRLDESRSSEPNVIERNIAPALIRRMHRTDALKAACILGGPGIETFLFRSDWRTEPDLSSRLGLPLGGGPPVNRWLYLLAHLPTPAGSQFRRKHEQKLMALADRLQHTCHEGLDLCGFLFLDLDRSSDSLAARYWPRYEALTTRLAGGSLAAQWRYLVKMEPVSTVEMYLEIWRGFSHGHTWYETGLRELDALATDKRQAVIDGLMHEVHETEVIPKGWRGSVSSWQDYIIRHLMHHASDEHVAEETLVRLQADPSSQNPRRIALWLEHTRPDHPLVAMLAEEPDHRLRLLVMGALKSHPTPANRAIMRQLLTDPAPEVKAAAQDVEAALRELAATEPSELAAGRSGSKPGQRSEMEEAE